MCQIVPGKFAAPLDRKEGSLLHISIKDYLDGV